MAAVGTPQGPTVPVGGALVAVGAALVVDGAAALDLAPPGAPVDQDLLQVDDSFYAVTYIYASGVHRSEIYSSVCVCRLLQLLRVQVRVSIGFLLVKFSWI